MKIECDTKNFKIIEFNLIKKIASLLLLSFAPGLALAANLDASALSLMWGIPFVGILLSIALVPLIAPQFWHHHFGKLSAFWGLLFFIPFVVNFGMHTAMVSFVHASLAEYIPFIILLTALFTVAGGIYIKGSLQGTPLLNVGILGVGAVFASLMGTTGASMLLLRPLIRANAHRKNQAHIIVFFIFIVANAGGTLTPLGDPPLFLGFLKGIDFFWTAKNLAGPTLFLVACLLAIFFIFDSFYIKKEDALVLEKKLTTEKIGFDGKVNFILLAGVIALVLMSGFWKSEIQFDAFGTPVTLPNLLRDVGLIFIILISLKITPKNVHSENQFSWAPMQEVAKLFAGIFLTIIPVIAMLQAGAEGPFKAVIAAVTFSDGQPNPVMYFWITGLLSAFLDNAPTYLVFFNTAGGDAVQLMTTFAPTLIAISAGAVFMGACTYIGNAPNMMVKAIAEERGIKMPSFFGYMVWSIGILLPLFLLITLIWF